MKKAASKMRLFLFYIVSKLFFSDYNLLLEPRTFTIL